MSLIDGSVRDLLAAFSSSDPTPGGGSAAALASSVGASLLLMVTALPKTRSGSDDDRRALAAAAGALSDLRHGLSAAIDADTAAYDQVVAAYRLPKSTDPEKAARKDAVQRALRGAIEVPLQVMQLSARSLEAAAAVAAHGNRGASSDVGVAVALLGCGLRGATLNVEINLTGVQDEAYRSNLRIELDRLGAAARASAEAAEAALA